MPDSLEIKRSDLANGLLLTLSGRIDSYWSHQLSSVLTEEIHRGRYRITLNLAGVRFISSAGVRVLMQFYKELAGLNGSLSVEQPSSDVVAVLEMVGLAQLLCRVPQSGAEGAEDRGTEIRRGNIVGSWFALGRGGLKGLLTGDPSPLHRAGYSEQDCKIQSYPSGRFGFGLGAIGQGFQDCRNRFGEFLALAGCAAYLPTDGTNHPDYLLQTGSLVPQINVLYALSFEGTMTHQLRFESVEGTTGVALSELMSLAGEVAPADPLGIVMVAEATGLVGAALTRSPFAVSPGTSPFAFPQVRDCMNFTTERAFSRHLILAAGVLTRQSNGPLAALTRSLSPGSPLNGHFHTAVFPYRPLKKGIDQLDEIARTLFEAGQILSVLHLLNDDRDIVGVGESEFSRGTCWIGPVSELVQEKGGAG
ncbi:MAG: STAS domain-containing protein [Acidobacteriota bacterium]